ncbi:isocitrate/isopropylmalate dehydrogenase family protein [Dielma fastidiosa]|uniref:isocitrate/isopropylmalate dehydrogenase family protein n=1 Tax=Dielma fastidiosa TaxID=1034346 RepID=UPI0023F30A52|nr:isocitrate/isopropylmalate dehydrogenase family protein [Dielma fastidiosa]
MKKVTLFKGDGIGPEICDQVVRIIDSLNLPLEFEPFEVGAAEYERHGALIPAAAFESIERNKVILKAPITTPIGKGFRSCNVQLREKYDLYANIRPAKSLPNVKTPFANVDMVIFRENTEDLYVGVEKQIDENTVHATKIITRRCSERIIRSAFEYAKEHHRQRVSCVHKANILKLSDGLFLKVFNEIKEEYPDVEANSYIVDNVCMQMVMHPEKFDVLVMPNLYGDITSDLASGLIGGLGLLPSANLGDEYAMFEAVHGSAPDIAGQNLANPTALLLSACMMLDYLGYHDEGEKVRAAINRVLIQGDVLTKDLGGSASTSEFTDAILQALQNA